MADLLSQVQDLIKATEEAKRAGRDANKFFEDGLNKITSSMDSTKRGMDQLSGSLTTFSKLAIENTNSFTGLADSLKGVAGSVGSFVTAMKNVPILGTVFSPLLTSVQKTAEVMSGAIGITEAFAAAYDGADKGTRDLINTQFAYSASLGQSFEQTKKNVDSYNELIKANSDLANAGTYFNSQDFISGIKYLQQYGMSMSDLVRTSELATNGMNNMQVMAMQARAMGMGIDEYARKMASMVRKSGLSMEESMKLMASSQIIAGETGLRVDEVTQALEGAVSGFEKMGATIDFGRPVLKGFADSIKEVGLGIEQAGAMSVEFSKSLLGIVNNPALAYVTAMKGGFAGAMGGPGGVLNPSIQMEAMMLSQEPGAQAELAKNLSSGMREMLTSQTGGQIVTVKEAASGDAAAQMAYTQQKMMLGSIYGVSDPTNQARILEYLEKLEMATAEGDQEQIDKINQQISEATNANDKTLDIQQKISASLDKSLILMQEQINLAKADFIAKGGEDKILGAVRKFTQISESLIGQTGPEAEAKMKSAEAELKLAFDKFAQQPSGEAQLPPQEAVGAGTEATLSASTGTQTNVQSVAADITINMFNQTGKQVDLTASSVAASPGNITINQKP